MIYFAIGLGIFTCIIVWYLKSYLNPYKRIFQPDPLPQDYEFSSTHSFEEIFIPVENGELHALHLKVGFSKGVVLYFHGNEGNIDSCLAVADDFLLKGYNLFIVDYRGFGKSKGSLSGPDTLYNDSLTAYNYLTKLYSESNIIVLGRSIGAPMATFVCSKNSPQTLILECPIAKIEDIGTYYYPQFIFKKLIPFDLSSEKWINSVKCPIYFFHGVSDKVVLLNCSKSLSSQANTQTHITIIQSSSHYSLRNYLEYQVQLEKILHPFATHIKPSEKEPPLVKPIYKIVNR